VAQHFLDPSDKTTVGERRPDRGVPESIRDAFGRYPNIDQWRPGDLLLFHIPEKTPLASKLIVKAQLANYALEHARWHHAAMYVGEGSLCEAHLIGGVQHNLINDYIGRHHIRVRRDMTLSDDDRHRLAIRAMARLKESYGWHEIPKLAFFAIRSFCALRNSRSAQEGLFARICTIWRIKGSQNEFCSTRGIGLLFPQNSA
jgi:hypothetical protein